MSNYRRLISYIYAYEGGIKGKNIGFAKIEARNGQCRIYVSVKKVYVGNNDMGVYLLAGDTEIYTGKIFVRNGSGEFRTAVLVGNVEGSGKTMDQCFGLTIHSIEDSWQSYTTIWEDATAQAAMIPAEAEEMVAHVAEVRQVENDTVEQAAEIVLHEVTSDQREEEEMRRLPETTIPEKKEEQLQPQPQIDETVSAPAPIENQEILEQLEQEEAQENQSDRLWQHFRHTYPKIDAFDYVNGCEILTIKPQDIGLLPRETWTYGNNSFLLHGYYNYRYLILVKLQNPSGEPRYLLGVPGHYYSNEKYMATMFGFSDFVLSKMQSAGDGRFGYWYADINMGNQ